MGTRPTIGPRERRRWRYQTGPSGIGRCLRWLVGRVWVSIRRVYAVAFVYGGHQPVPNWAMIAIAAVASVIAWRDSMMISAAFLAVVVVVSWWRSRVIGWPVIAAVVVLAVVGWRASTEWAALVPDVGEVTGWVRIVDDPQPLGSATRVIVEIDGHRYEIWGRGRARQQRLQSWRGGDYVLVSGQRRALSPDRQRRVAWQHVVGQFELDWAADTTVGTPIDRASNRVRAAIETAGRSLPGDDGSLYRGLVIGDDRDQPPDMIDRFRASGLSHLTAVSGQNVAFVLAAAGPFLRRLRPWWRWMVTVALIVWFVSLTRYEPSIVRAGAMAILSATGFVLGHQRTPLRLLAVAVIALMVIDPLVVVSVGWWLSVGATVGVITVGPWLGERLAVLGWGRVGMLVGVTLGAQVGVAIPALVTFGRMPVVSVVANLVAVPVAGFVMLYGLPAGLVAGLVPPISTLVMWPCRVGVRWVDTVAQVAARLEPGGAATWWWWAVVIVVVTVAASWAQRREATASCGADGS